MPSALGEVAALRRVMNDIVGSRAAKARVASEGRLAHIAAVLVAPDMDDDARILAANILGSVAQHATPATLLALLRADAPFLLLTRLGEIASEVGRADAHGAPLVTRALESVLRALRAVICAVSDQVGPAPRWGIGSGWGSASTAGLEHTDSRNSSLPPNRPTTHSLRQDTSWNAAGPSATDVRTAIAEAWAPGVPSAAWTSRHTNTEHSPKAARTRHDEELPSYASVPRTYDAEYKAMCASLDEASVLDEHPPAAALNWLCRAAISVVFDAKSLHLLLGAVLFAAEAMPRKASGADSPDTSGAIRTRSMLLQGRTHTLGIIETVSELLGACLAIPGIEHYPGSADAARLRVTRRTSHTHTPPPEEELAQRCAAVLQFAPWDNPFALPGSASPPSDGTAPTAVHALLDAAESARARIQEAVLWLFHELLACGSSASVHALLAVRTRPSAPLVHVVQTLSQSRTQSVRLAAFACLAQLASTDAAAAPLSRAGLLQGIMGLLEARGAVQVQACFVLARLVCDCAELQALAVGRFGACERLGALLQRTAPQVTATHGARAADELTVRLHEGSLTALASLAVLSDAVRRHVVECAPAFLSSILLPSLNAHAVGVQIAACRLVRVLSRTVGVLRTSLFDAGFAERLLALLVQDECELIHTEIIATVCNMLVKFSPMRQFLLDHGGLEALARHARSVHGPVRVNALWAIKNAVWDSDSVFKTRAMELLSWDYLAELTQARDVRIQEQALNIVRNLTSSQAANSSYADIDMTLARFGEERLLDCIEEVVWSLRNEPATEQVAYVLANIASGTEHHRALIISRANLLDALCYFLRHTSHTIREAGVRCGFNLTYPMADVLPEAGEPVWRRAAARLRAFGYDKLLKELEYDTDVGVRERVRDTLAQI